MEILILAIFIGVVITIGLLRNKLPPKIQLAIAVLAGILLIGWFWSQQDDKWWNIIVTVVVLSSWFRLWKKLPRPS